MEQKEKAVKIANIIKEALAKHPEFGLVMPLVYNSNINVTNRPNYDSY